MYFFLIKKSRNTKKSPNISQLSLFWVVVNPNIILFWLIVEWHLNFCEMLKDFIVTIKEHFFFCLVKKEKRHFNYLSTRFLDSVRCPIWLESLIWIENLNFHFTILNFLLFKNKHLEQFMDLTSHNTFLFHWTSCDFVLFVIKKRQKQFNTWIRQKHFIVLYITWFPFFIRLDLHSVDPVLRPMSWTQKIKQLIKTWRCGVSIPVPLAC